MKLNTILFTSLIALLFLAGLAFAFEYDISSYNDAGQADNVIPKISFTATKTQAIFVFQLKNELDLKEHIFQASLPSYMKVPDSGHGCNLTIRTASGSKTPVDGTITTPLWGNSPGNFVQCTISASDFKITTTDTVQLTFTGLTQTKPQLSPECVASIAKCPQNIPLLPNPPIQELFSLDTHACCENVFLQLFNKDERGLARVFPDFCNLSTSTSINDMCHPHCPIKTIRLTSLNVDVEEYIVKTPTSVTATFRTAEDLDASSPKLAGSVTANGENVPSYIWVYLPKFRVTSKTVHGLTAENGYFDATKFGITCKITHKFLETAVTHAKTQYSASPQILVRPLGNNQADGVIVQCALQKDIPATSYVSVEIKGLTSPSDVSTCAHFGLIAHSEHCCNDYTVEYRHGNAYHSTIIARSFGAESCPNFFEDAESASMASKRPITQLEFSPHGYITPGSEVKIPYYSFFVSQEISSSVDMTWIFSLPGFTLDKFPQPDTDGWCTLAPEEIKIQTALTSTIQHKSAKVRLTKDGVLQFALTGVKVEKEKFAKVFFPKLKTTDSLPRTSTCRGSIAGIPSQDDTCCRGFQLQVKNKNQSIIAISSSTCPVIADGATTSLKSCINTKTFNKESCCMHPSYFYFMDSDLYEACLEYRCADSTSPRFNTGLCCSNGLYRHNAQCCSGGVFCPNHCCGNHIPAFNDPITGQLVPEAIGFFNHHMCCQPKKPNTTPSVDTDYLYNWDGSNMHHICTCYELMKDEDWEEFGKQKCCEAQTTFVMNGLPVALPPVCACLELYDALDEANTPAAKNDIISAWEEENRTIHTKYCCGFIGKDGDIFENAGNLEEWCECKEMTGSLTTTAPDCCEYDAFVNRCPPLPAPACEPCECPTTNCSSCPSCNCDGNQQCSNTKKQTVEISNLTSGADTVVSIAAPSIKKADANAISAPGHREL